MEEGGGREGWTDGVKEGERGEVGRGEAGRERAGREGARE